MASNFGIVNAASKGGVGRKLRKLRSKGTTFDQIADEFAKDGIVVSRETIRQWCVEQGIPKGAAA